MNKIVLFFHTFICIFLFSVAVISCTLETSDNGDLDGFWHLTSIDTLSTGGACNMSNSLVFWSVQMNLLNVVDKDKSGYGYIMRFEHRGTLLRIYEPHFDNRMEGDPLLEDVSLLAPFGINSLEETFSVEKLNGSKMVLKNDEFILRFTKM